MTSNYSKKAFFVGLASLIFLAAAPETTFGFGSSTPQIVGQWSDEENQRVLEFFEDKAFSLQTKRGEISGKWTILSDGRIKMEAVALGSAKILLGTVEDGNLMLKENAKQTSTWHRGQLRTQGMEEAKKMLAKAYVMATVHFGERGTFEIKNLKDLGLELEPGQYRYSLWFAVNGKPTMIPGSGNFAAGSCNTSNPPTSVKVLATGREFVAAVKGNVDDDATCDEWSINDNKEFKHTLDDALR